MTLPSATSPSGSHPTEGRTMDPSLRSRAEPLGGAYAFTFG